MFLGLPSSLTYAAIIAALFLFVVAEVLIQYRKFQLKKLYNQELDEYERSKFDNDEASTEEDSKTRK